MKAYEYYAEVLPDGHLSVPDDLRDKLAANLRARVMLLLEDDETVWNVHTVSQFMKRYPDNDALYDNV
jgi:hypothetical protein